MAQNSRRGRSGRRRQGGGGNNPNRSMDSQGPEVKIRGNAQQIYDKYTALARDAFSSGDRVRGESLQQHAEHYYRLLQAMQPKDRPAEQQDMQQDGGNAPNGARDNRDARENRDGRDSRDARDPRAERDGQERHQNKDREDGAVAARSAPEPARMDGAEQAASDDAQGSDASAAPDLQSDEAPKRRRRRRTRRDEAEGEASSETGSDSGSGTASEASGDAPGARNANGSADSVADKPAEKRVRKSAKASDADRPAETPAEKAAEDAPA